MSTFVTVEKQCWNCGIKSSFRALMSTNAFGAPDLDLRPPEMKRSTMSMWLEECPHCGYVSEDISEKPNFDKEYLLSDEYKTCGGYHFSSKLAGSFFRRALIATLTKDAEEAYENILHAAWCCDDRNDAKNARLCRRMLDALFEQVPAYFKLDINLILRHIDILRRAEMFDKAISLCDSTKSDETLIESIIEFQKEKCAQQDTGVYTVAQAAPKE